MIGWDILPRFISAGIFRDVRLEVRKPERIRDQFCALLQFDPQKRSARYLLDMRLEGSFRRLDHSEIVVTVSRNGKVVSKPRTQGAARAHSSALPLHRLGAGTPDA